MIRFNENGHKYESIIPDNTEWLSVTGVLSLLKPKFDPPAAARKCITNKKSKWYGMPFKEVLEAWDNEGKRSVQTGHWYHNQVEQQLLSQKQVEGLQVFGYKKEGEYKIAPEQKLVEGVYPEHMVYLRSAAICGQSDIVKVKGNGVFITDHKTSKEIKTKGFTNWEGVEEKMLGPVKHLGNCEFNHYALQLSIYMYVILRHNPHLVPGDMVINHVKLKEDSKDKYGYPVHTVTEDGGYVVEEVTPITVPYLHKEAHSVIEWIKEPKNRKR